MSFYRNIWENGSNLKGKYNQFVFKYFDFSPFEVSSLNTYHIVRRGVRTPHLLANPPLLVYQPTLQPFSNCIQIIQFVQTLVITI